MSPRWGFGFFVDPLAWKNKVEIMLLLQSEMVKGITNTQGVALG